MRSLRLVTVAALLAAGALPGTAAAQGDAQAQQEPEFDLDAFFAERGKQKPIDEVASDLAYGFCPLFLANQFALTGNPQLASFGFGNTVEESDSPQGKVRAVTLKRADGEIAFGGIEGTLCSVTVRGDQRAAAVKRWHDSMGFMGIEFAPDEANSGSRGDTRLESFSGPVADGSGVLHVQLIEMPSQAAVVAQLYFTAE